MHMGGEVNILEAWRERIRFEIGFSERATGEWPESYIRIAKMQPLEICGYISGFCPHSLANSILCMPNWISASLGLHPTTSAENLRELFLLLDFSPCSGLILLLGEEQGGKRRARPWRDPVIWLVSHASSPGALSCGFSPIHTER